MPAFIWLQGNINSTIFPNTCNISYEFLPFVVLLINLITINQSRILIIDRYLHPQISEGVYLQVHFLPSVEFVRLNCFD